MFYVEAVVGSDVGPFELSTTVPGPTMEDRSIEKIDLSFKLHLTMASKSGSQTMQVHSRSISLPARLNPNSAHIEAELNKFKTWEEEESSSAAAAA
ncbi:hypothetical protein QYF36_017966 [Acer negundo]|nr:hypothetical protein QYF36_017966 [Acer negundo]